MNYRTRHLTARVPLLYMDAEVLPGQRFTATPTDADYLVRCKRAEDAAAPAAPPVPAATPTPTPAPDAPVESTGKPSDGLNVAQLREALAAKNIPVSPGYVPKAELAALLDRGAD